MDTKEMTTVDDYDFMKWFVRYYKPDPKEQGWFIDKLSPGAKVTMEGAREVYGLFKEHFKKSNQ